VVPADHRLHPEHGAAGQRHARLEVDGELAAGQRRRHRRGQVVAGDLVGVAVLVEQRPPAAAVRLRPVHRDVGGPQQLVGARLGGAPLHHPGARGDGQFVPVDQHRAGENGQRLPGDVDHVPRSRRIPDEDDELVPAHAGDEMAGRRRRRRQPGRDGGEHGVARRMPQPVVDLLEAVEVEEAQPHPAALDRAGREDLVEPVEQQRPVREAGQRIVQRLPAQRLLPVPKCLLDVLPGDQRRPLDRFLLGADPVPQRRRVPGGEPTLDRGDPPRGPLRCVLPAAGEPATDQLDRAAERFRAGELGGHQVRADLGGRTRVERLAAQAVGQPVGQRPQPFADLGGTHRHEARTRHGGRPGPGEAVHRLRRRFPHDLTSRRPSGPASRPAARRGGLGVRRPGHGRRRAPRAGVGRRHRASLARSAS
jgi:hypothetical protein